MKNKRLESLKFAFIAIILIMVTCKANAADLIFEKSFDFNSDSSQVADAIFVKHKQNSFYVGFNIAKGKDEEDGLDYYFPALMKTSKSGDLIWKYSKRFANKVVCRNVNFQTDGNIKLECLWIRVFGFFQNIDFRPLNILLDSNGKELSINIDSNTVLPMRFWHEGGWIDDGNHYINFTTNVAKLKAIHYITRWDKLTCQFVEQRIIDSTDFNYLNQGFSYISKAFPSKTPIIQIQNRAESNTNFVKENLLVEAQGTSIGKSNIAYQYTAPSNELTENVATHYSDQNSKFYFFQTVMDTSNTNIKRYTLNLFDENSKQTSKVNFPLHWNTRRMRVNNHKNNFTFFTYDTVKNEIKGLVSDLNLNFLDSFVIQANWIYTNTNNFVSDINGSEILVCNIYNKVPNNIIELRLYNSLPTSVESEPLTISNITQSTHIELYDILGRSIATFPSYERLKAELDNYPAPHLIKWRDEKGISHFEKMK